MSDRTRWADSLPEVAYPSAAVALDRLTAIVTDCLEPDEIASYEDEAAAHIRGLRIADGRSSDRRTDFLDVTSDEFLRWVAIWHLALSQAAPVGTPKVLRFAEAALRTLWKRRQHDVRLHRPDGDI